MGSDRGSLVSWEALECFPSTLTLLTLAWKEAFPSIFQEGWEWEWKSLWDTAADSTGISCPGGQDAEELGKGKMDLGWGGAAMT